METSRHSSVEEWMNCDLFIQRNTVNNRKEWTTDTHNMDEFQKYDAEWEEARDSRVTDSQELQEEIAGSRDRGLTRKKHEIVFRVDGDLIGV